MEKKDEWMKRSTVGDNNDGVGERERALHFPHVRIKGCGTCCKFVAALSVVGDLVHCLRWLGSVMSAAGSSGSGRGGSSGGGGSPEEEAAPEEEAVAEERWVIGCGHTSSLT